MEKHAIPHLHLTNVQFIVASMNTCAQELRIRLDVKPRICVWRRQKIKMVNIVPSNRFAAPVRLMMFLVLKDGSITDAKSHRCVLPHLPHLAPCIAQLNVERTRYNADRTLMRKAARNQMYASIKYLAQNHVPMVNVGALHSALRNVKQTS